MPDPTRILALFGARVIFGQERANIEVLAALRDVGCEVLCVIRPEEWPEIMAVRAALDARATWHGPRPHTSTIQCAAGCFKWPATMWVLTLRGTSP